MLRSHRFGAIIEVRRLVTKLHDGCACTVRWPALLYNLNWFSVSDYMKNMEYTDSRKCIQVYAWQNCHNR